MLIIAFALSILIGGWMSAALARRRPLWTARRRIIRSASLLPALVLLASLAGIAWELVGPRGTGENMRDLAIAVYLVLGAWFVILTLVGGLIGAALVERKRQ